MTFTWIFWWVTLVHLWCIVMQIHSVRGCLITVVQCTILQQCLCQIGVFRDIAEVMPWIIYALNLWPMDSRQNCNMRGVQPMWNLGIVMRNRCFQTYSLMLLNNSLRDSAVIISSLWGNPLIYLFLTGKGRRVDVLRTWQVNNVKSQQCYLFLLVNSSTEKRLMVKQFVILAYAACCKSVSESSARQVFLRIGPD